VTLAVKEPLLTPVCTRLFEPIVGTDINGGPVSGQHVNLLHQKMTADDDDDCPE